MLPAPLPMHIPDGFLSVLVSLVLWIISAGAIYVALRRVGQQIAERQVPLMGVLAAAIFAGQMLNFSIAGGTSGHLLGAAIATILVGPWPAMIIMTCVVSIQALVFQDGGLLALGGNILNMAVFAVAASQFVFASVRRMLASRRWGLLAAGAAAAWGSIVAASLACALELAASGTSPANIAVPAMGGVHLVIGIGEALATLGALAFLSAARPDLLQAKSWSAGSSRAVWVVGLLVTLALAVFAPLASARPDGLEWVATQNDFLDAARDPIYRLIPDYVVPGIPNTALATILAGVVGALLVLASTLAVMHFRGRRAANPG